MASGPSSPALALEPFVHFLVSLLYNDTREREFASQLFQPLEFLKVLL